MKKNIYKYGLMLVPVMLFAFVVANAVTVSASTGDRTFGMRGENCPLTEEERTARMEERAENKELVREAILNNDYQSFKELTANSPFAEKVNETNFSKIVQVHALRESGDYEEARDMMRDLGIGRKGTRGPGHGFGNSPKFQAE